MATTNKKGVDFIKAITSIISKSTGFESTLKKVKKVFYQNMKIASQPNGLTLQCMKAIWVADSYYQLPLPKLIECYLLIGETVNLDKE